MASMTRRSAALLPLGVAIAADSAARIRTAMIGTGHGHASSKILALQSMAAEYEFLGVCRPDPEDPAIGPGFQNAKWLQARDVLADPSIEMLAIEFADPQANLEYGRKAIDAGKFVHLDKPPGADLRAFRELLEVAKRKNRVVQLGYQWRYHPAMQAAMTAARNGWLGRVYRFRASIDKPILADERRHLAKYKGGMMFSEGCHLIDRATALLGEPRKVTGFLQRNNASDQLADNNLVILEYPDAIAEISLAGYDPNGNAHRYIEILGTNGSAKVQPYTGSHLRVELKTAAGPYKAGVQELSPPDGPGRAYTPDFAEMASIIRKGTAPTYSAAHDLMTHRVLLEACGML
jgi:predicted dehydrogenase